MSERDVWEDMYCFRLTKSAALSAIVPADTAVFNDPVHSTNCFVSGSNSIMDDVNQGVTTSVYGIPLTNHPTMDIGQAIIDQRKATGVSYKNTSTGMEYQQGTRLPTTTWEFDVTKNNIAPFLWLLFQNGASEAGASAYVKTFVPYTEGNVTEVHAALCRVMSTQVGDANSHLFGGCVVSSITFTGEEGQPLKASVTLMGYNAITDFEFGAAANICVFDSSCAPLLYQNAVISVAGTTVNIPRFNLTITNNLKPAYYNSKHPTKFIYNDIDISGSFDLPWSQATVGANVELDKFVAGTDSQFICYWGHNPASADGDLALTANARYNGMPVEGEDETILKCSFAGAYDGANAAVSITVADAINRTIA
jgi:hypothetical protein